MIGWLTPKFSCKHTITIAAKPHPKSACQLQRSLAGVRTLVNPFQIYAKNRMIGVSLRATGE
jgi:hypothetical protein